MKNSFAFILFLNLCVAFAQNRAVVYPEGIYNTFEEFNLRKPGVETAISARQGKNVVITTFRIKDGEGNAVKDAFAVSDGQHLYVRTNAMLDHLTNTEYNKPNATNKDYSIARWVNDDYLYLEVFFQNKSLRTWGIGQVYLAGILYDSAGQKFTFLDTQKDLERALGEKATGVGMDENERINGEQIGLTRKAIAVLFENR